MVNLKKKYVTLPSCDEYPDYSGNIAGCVAHMLDEVFHFYKIDAMTVEGYGTGYICYLTEDDVMTEGQESAKGTGIYVGYGQIDSTWKLMIYLVHGFEIVEYAQIYDGGVYGYFVLEYETNSGDKTRGGFNFHKTDLSSAPNAWGNITCLVTRGVYKTDDIDKLEFGCYAMQINKATLVITHDSKYYEACTAGTNAMADIVSMAPLCYMDKHESEYTTIFEPEGLYLAIVYPRKFESDVFILDGHKYLSLSVKVDASYLGYQRAVIALD